MAQTDRTQILIIEDDFQDVEIVKAMLYQDQESLTTLSHSMTITDGINTLKRGETIDLVLLDLALPDGQGLETFRQVYEAFPEVPLIILSGNTDEELALEALQAGAQDYLVKGRFDGDLLSRSIRYAMERQYQRLELECKTQALKLLSQQLELANLELKQLAEIDGLTRVYNRRRFDELLLAEWSRQTREGNPLGLILCDVDHFKAYNDTYGHPSGDRCLQQIGLAIRKAAKRPADIVARYGGEEFVVVLPNTDLKGATYVAEAIQSELQQLDLPHATSSVRNHVTLSLGVASLVPTEEGAPSLLLEAADQALYRAKEEGRDRIQAYQADCSNQNLTSRRTLQWVSRLRQALERDQFHLYAQPIRSLRLSDTQQHFEILLRLSDQSGTVLTPGMFLPIAEQYNFMSRIDCWVIEHLFSSLAQYPARDLEDRQFYINLSSTTCKHSQLSEFVQTQLLRYDLQAQNFCFEVSEKVAIANLAEASELTQALKSIGAQVALDDFGSGMSSFAHLKTIPADYVKIDGLFVKDIGMNSVSKAIVEAIHHVAKIMNLQTIAEYVESEVILDTLCQLGVDYAQGHYFDRARPLAQTLATWNAPSSSPYLKGLVYPG